MARRQFRVRTLMALVLYVAVDCAAYSRAVRHGSDRWLHVFLLMTFLVPAVLGQCWLIQRIIEWSGRTLS
ncbi:MAG TPA: hypothetical protein VF590_21030 [Isosphaeraceae bacterium]|jgi:hypothetical protein